MFACNAGTTSRIAECYDRVKYPMEDQEACPCPKHTIQLAGVWSHCQLDADLTQFDLDLHERSIGQLRPGRGYCGVGSRSHALVCVEPDGKNVSALVCGSSGWSASKISLVKVSDFNVSRLSLNVLLKYDKTKSLIMQYLIQTAHCKRRSWLLIDI